ncbi:MAG: hypothetical protein IPM54_24925 [Polyangiaceae bacterium]|nr:hypothetical protein [Polyangiaceae bacterium]
MKGDKPVTASDLIALLVGEQRLTALVSEANEIADEDGADEIDGDLAIVECVSAELDGYSDVLYGNTVSEDAEQLVRMAMRNGIMLLTVAARASRRVQPASEVDTSNITSEDD